MTTSGHGESHNQRPQRVNLPERHVHHHVLNVIEDRAGGEQITERIATPARAMGRWGKR